MNSQQLHQSPSEAARHAYGGEEKNTYADIYTDTISTLGVKQEQYADIAMAILPEIKQNPQLTILEFGPGQLPHLPQFIESAGYGRKLDTTNTGIHYIGLDLYPKMINKDPSFPISMVQTDISESLPLPAESVDCIVINSVLLSLDTASLPNLFSEIYRVLKADGTIVISELDQSIGANISHNVIEREKALIQQEVLSGVQLSEVLINKLTDGNLNLELRDNMPNRLHYYAKLVGRFISTFKHKAISDRANQIITSSHQGFTLEELELLLRNSGLKIESRARTYADSYYLVKARKRASSVIVDSLTLV